MWFSRKEKKYSVLYKNQLWSLDVGTFSIIWTKRDLRKKYEKEGIFIQEIIDLEKILTYSRNVTWTDEQLFNFTRYFRLELSKWIDSVVSPKDALKEVYKKTFNPLVYAILSEVENNRKFEDVISEYPKIFDEIYRSTVNWYFWNKYEPIEGLKKLEKYIIWKQEFKKKLVDKTRMSIITITLVVILSYVLDWIIYEMIKENFNSYWKPLPDFTTLYHNSLYFVVKYIWPMLILLWLLWIIYDLLQWDKIKIWLWKLKLELPFYWAIHRKKSIYDIIDTLVIMRESDIRMRDLLLILSNSTDNYFYKKVILEVREWIKAWKHIWNEFEQFGIFTWPDEDVIHAFKSSNMDESFNSLRDVKKVELEDLTNKTLRSLTAFMVILSLFMWFSMGYAYYKPVQMQSSLVKDQINADKQAALDNN